MCGFFIEFKKKSFNHDIENFNNSSKLMLHRGDTPVKSYFDKNFRSNFFRLKIIDLSNKGNQPMFDHSKRYLINFNGEIYNAKKLRQYLPEIKLKSNSDTEILVNLFSKYNFRCLKLIEGMFSFVIYDKLENKCFVARDRFGIKPLYFSENQNSYVLSSEIKPILKYNKKNNLFNLKTFGNLLIDGYLDHGEDTFFKNISSIESGHYIVLTKYKKKKFKYWDLSKKLFNYKSPNSDKLKTLLSESLNQHLISDRKIGLFLSGGTDSNFLATYFSKNLKYQMTTYTYDFISKKFGESEAAKKSCKYLGLKNKIYKLKPADVVDNMSDLTETLESPFTSMRLFAVNSLYKLAKEDNLKVIVEGHGGDEMFGSYGYNYFPYLTDEYNTDYLKRKFGKNIFRKKMLTKKHQGKYTTDGTLGVDLDLLNKDFYSDYVKSKNNLEFKTKCKLNNLQKSQIYDIKYIKLPRMLKYTDRISMKHSIETRVPFLNHNLFNFCYHLKNKEKYNKRYGSRYLLKKTLHSYDLKSFFQKNKRDIVDPQKLWLSTYLEDFFIDTINSSNSTFNDIFDKNKIIKKYELFKKSKNSSSFYLFVILTTSIFLNRFSKTYG